MRNFFYFACSNLNRSDEAVTGGIKPTMRDTLFICWLLLYTLPLTAGPLTFKSTPEQTLLLELYTSEGCSSCPAADRWLAKLVDHKDLWKKIIPVAFHVDYWDRLGWKDRFASAEFSRRQRRYYQTGNAKAVYTPGFFLNGKEWRSWFRRPVLGYTPERRPGILTATVGADKIQVRYQPLRPPRQPLTAHLVLLGTGIRNRIKNGENAGKILTHTFVVLAHHTRPQRSGDILHWTFPYTRKKHHGSQAAAIAVWISTTGNPTPLQSVGGWLKPPQNRDRANEQQAVKTE